MNYQCFLMYTMLSLKGLFYLWEGANLTISSKSVVFNMISLLLIFIFRRSDFPKILKLFPKAELKYIEGAGHWVHAEKPNEFLKITMDFLNKDSAT